jgi:hypothetical protein
MHLARDHAKQEIWQAQMAISISVIPMTRKISDQRYDVDTRPSGHYLRGSVDFRRLQYYIRR